MIALDYHTILVIIIIFSLNFFFTICSTFLHDLQHIIFFPEVKELGVD